MWNIHSECNSSYRLVLWDQKVSKVLKTCSVHVPCRANVNSLFRNQQCYGLFLSEGCYYGHNALGCRVSGICFYFFSNRSVSRESKQKVREFPVCSFQIEEILACFFVGIGCYSLLVLTLCCSSESNTFICTGHNF